MNEHSTSSRRFRLQSTFLLSRGPISDIIIALGNYLNWAECPGSDRFLAARRRINFCERFLMAR